MSAQIRLLVHGIKRSNWSEKSLRTKFQEYGRVSDVFFSEKGGYAFVSMDSEVDAYESIKNLNLTTINGQKIRVEIVHGGDECSSVEKPSDSYGCDANVRSKVSSQLVNAVSLRNRHRESYLAASQDLFGGTALEEIDGALNNMFHGQLSARFKIDLLSMLMDVCNSSPTCLEYFLHKTERFFGAIVSFAGPEDLYWLIIQLISLKDPMAAKIGSKLSSLLDKKYPALAVYRSKQMSDGTGRSSEVLDHRSDETDVKDESEQSDIHGAKNFVEKRRRIYSKCSGEIKDAKINYDKMKERVKEGKEELDQINDMMKEAKEEFQKFTCQVCGSEPVNIFHDCQHVTCATCSNKLERCPFCRKEIVTRLKIYF